MILKKKNPKVTYCATCIYQENNICHRTSSHAKVDDNDWCVKGVDITDKELRERIKKGGLKWIR